MTVTLIGLCDRKSPNRINPDDFFAQPGTIEGQRAKALCDACPLRDGCSEYALTQGVSHGIWGGLSNADRKHAWKRLPGGRPALFMDSYEAHIRPLLQERRDHETFDERFPVRRTEGFDEREDRKDERRVVREEVA